MPGIWTLGADASAFATFASEPTSSFSARPVCSTCAGASSAARIVGARSTSSGGCSNGRTAGPTATITLSGRWSPEIQSAVLERGLRVRERVPDLGLHQDDWRRVGVADPPRKG
jgi:hypothetical protein